ncbi:TRAP transporter large permease [Deltaproteobacteria bacterium]|nr:TRAP transporter large permease [Deltaproteobacteria bacterium]
MSPEIVGLIGVGILIVLLFLRVWVGIAMASVGFLGFAYITNFKYAFQIMGSVPYSSIANETVAAVPLFILMGVMVSNTGVAGDLYRTAYKWLGQFRGGLAMATVVACGGFAAISGSSPATAATMGKVALPEMKKYNYDLKLTTGSVAAGGTIGILIPPSMGFILYGILTEESIGKLFMAGIIPGILEILFYIGTIFILCRINPMLGPAGPKTTFSEKLASLKYTWAMLALFFLVMGGIYGGWFTPTEAGAIGAFGAIVISAIAGKFTRENFFASILEAAQTTAMMVLIIASAFIFMKFMVVSRLPDFLANFIVGLPFSPTVILLIIILLYILLGMFLDAPSAMVLTLPILFPVILSLGFDPIWYGVIMVRVIEVGLITPPMGMNVFILAGVTNTPLKVIFKGIIPFVIADVFHIVLLVSFPVLSLFLPNIM